jgi:hypothetical protein
MHRSVFGWMFFFLLCGGSVQAQTDVSTLYAQLTQLRTTDGAAKSIRDAASQDRTAKGFVAERIPSLLTSSRKTGDEVWMNAVRLAGQLKVVAAIPALKEALSVGPIRGGYDNQSPVISASQYFQLRYDIVARALADIGDPSIPTAADILSHGDAADRKRAVSILSNINSPAANQAMRDHLPVEQDPQIKEMIQRSLPEPK